MAVSEGLTAGRDRLELEAGAQTDDILSDMKVPVGTKLREARELRGISQAELARIAGTTQAHVSRVERGLVSPTIRVAESLLRATGHQMTLDAAPLYGSVDDEALIRFRALSPAERLEQAFAASAFASELLDQAS